jgi:metal-sulfur cluster biosynthetic enzyme
MTDLPVPEPVHGAVKWDIEETHPALVELLKDGFRQVYDPEIGMNIIQLGLVRNVSHQPDGGFIVNMIMTTPFCPYASTLIDAALQKAQTILPEPVSMSLGMDVWDFSMMEDPSGFDWGLY